MLIAYRLDVLDRRVTPRRLQVLLERLPAGSWPIDDRATAWSVEAHLLATLIDAVQWNTYATLLPHVKGTPSKPKPVRRPGERDKRTGLASVARLLMGGGDGR